jgi:hypothetical protein
MSYGRNLWPAQGCVHECGGRFVCSVEPHSAASYSQTLRKTFLAFRNTTEFQKENNYLVSHTDTADKIQVYLDMPPNYTTRCKGSIFIIITSGKEKM